MDPRWGLMPEETHSADWQSAVSRIGNPLIIQHFNAAAALPIANRRYGRLTKRPHTGTWSNL